MLNIIRRFAQPTFLFETPAGGGGEPSGEQGGQGGGGGGDDLYGPYLADVPEELRPLVTEPLKRQNSDFTRRFQEAAQFRQQFEPLSKIEGLTDMDPEGLQALLAFSQEQLSGPEKFNPWLRDLALNDPDAQILDEDTWTQVGQARGWLGEGEGYEGGDEGSTTCRPGRRSSARGSSPSSSTSEPSSRPRPPSRPARSSRSASPIIYKEHGDVDAETHDAIVDLALSMQQRDPNEQDPVGRAFERITKIRGTREGDEVEERLARRNGATLSGGQPDTAPPKLSWNRRQRRIPPRSGPGTAQAVDNP
jgi:hypothetical protein